MNIFRASDGSLEIFIDQITAVGYSKKEVDVMIPDPCPSNPGRMKTTGEKRLRITCRIWLTGGTFFDLGEKATVEYKIAIAQYLEVFQSHKDEKTMGN